MYNMFKNNVQKFLKDDRGVATVEVVIILPLVALVLMSCFTFFDAIRKHKNAQNITYTISDIISRYTEFDDAQLNDLNDIFNEVTLSNDNYTSIRVTSISEYFGDLKIDWSTSTNGAGIISNVNQLDVETIPDLFVGETVLLVQTSVRWVPFSDWVGIVARQIESDIIVSPRFAGKLEYVTNSTLETGL